MKYHKWPILKDAGEYPSKAACLEIYKGDEMSLRMWCYLYW